MLHVLNTRPIERADGLNQALLQAGYPVTALPLLELVAEPFEVIQQPLSQIQQANTVVVVSPAAAQLGLAALKPLNILPSQLGCQWVAVGQGTAAVLAQAGITAHVPALETSEGMLALEVFQQASQGQSSSELALATVMFWRGYGGRQFMLKQLASQHHVVSVNLYHRQLPSTSALAYQQLLDQPPQVLLISSGVSWQNWLALGQQFGRMIPLYILVLGQRVYHHICQQLNDQQIHDMAPDLALQPSVILLDNLAPDTILSLLERLQKCQ